MASRRLSDLIAVFSASSAVARKHYLIRTRQLNLYASTSSIDTLPDTSTTSPAVIGASKQEKRGIEDLASEISKDVGMVSTTITEQVWISSL